MSSFSRTIPLIALLLSSLSFPTKALSNKRFKPLKAAVKTGQGIDAAIKLVSTLEQDSSITKPKDRVQLAQYGFELYDTQFKKENELQYLKRNYDTTRYFNAILGMATYAIRCYTLEEQYNNTGKATLHYSPNNHSKLSPIITNLHAAGAFYYKKKNYRQAAHFFSAYLSAYSSPLLTKYGTASPKTPLSSTAYLAANAYAALDSIPQMIHYGRIALTDSIHTLNTYRLWTTALEHHSDTAQYTAVLEEAFAHFPQDQQFFAHLSEVYFARQRHNEVLQIADSLSSLYRALPIYTYVKSVALLRLERYKPCIDYSRQVLDSAKQNDSLYTDAYYNIGYSYCMLADTPAPHATKLSERQAAIKARNQLYANARPYLEEFRRRRPAQRQLWYPLLYNIYYRLNLGRELQALERE